MLRRILKMIVVSALFVAATPLAASAGNTEFEADLDPGQETAVVDSKGEGEAEFTVKRNKIRFELEWEDLTSGAVAAHIHCAAAGVDGAVGVTLLSEAKGTDGKVKGSFSAPDPGNGCGWASLNDVLTAMVTGNAYVNVHTANFLPGEIRGQIAPEDLEFEADLDPGQEVQAVVSDGEGEAEFTLRRDKVRFKLEWDDLTSSAVAAHIHCAPAGSNGDVGVTLLAETKGTDGKVKGSFRAPDAGNACGWLTLSDVLAAMVTGNAYVNVHTTNFPGGEIRGQIEID